MTKFKCKCELSPAVEVLSVHENVGLINVPEEH